MREQSHLERMQVKARISAAFDVPPDGPESEIICMQMIGRYGLPYGRGIRDDDHCHCRILSLDHQRTAWISLFHDPWCGHGAYLPSAEVHRAVDCARVLSRLGNGDSSPSPCHSPLLPFLQSGSRPSASPCPFLHTASLAGRPGWAKRRPEVLSSRVTSSFPYAFVAHMRAGCMRRDWHVCGLGRMVGRFEWLEWLGCERESWKAEEGAPGVGLGWGREHTRSIEVQMVGEW